MTPERPVLVFDFGAQYVQLIARRGVGDENDEGPGMADAFTAQGKTLYLKREMGSCF